MRRVGLFLFLLILITYSNSLFNEFLSDDIAEIVNNPKIGDLSIIAERPFGFIRLVFYWTAFKIGGLNPVFFRLINIFFHLGSTILVFAILKQLSSKRLALVVASIFAIHPAISEAVVWISGGSYPQYAFFFLLSFYMYILSKDRLKLYFLSIIGYLFAFMSHPQMPIALFLLYPLYELCFGNFRKNWKKALPFLFISLAYLAISFSTLPERENTLKSVHYQEGGIDNPFILIPYALTSYLELIFFPKNLTIYHSELAMSTLNYLTRAILILILFILAFLSFKKNKFIFFWFSFFILALSPTITPFRLTWVVAERYLYLPILGILAIVAHLLKKWLEDKKSNSAFLTVFGVILTLLIFRTIFRNIDWKNQDNLWLAASYTSPSSPNNHNNLGDLYGRRGDKQKAIEEFKKAITLKPNYGDAYHNLANTYAEMGQTDLALENYQKAIEFNPNLWQSYQNIAAIFYQAKQYERALEFMLKAVQINPNNLNLWNNLAVIHLGKGDKQKAKEIFNQVLSLDPANQFAQTGLQEASK